MALPDLSKMKDEEYKLLTPEQLMQYNKSMPSIDYANPYQHQPFPKAMYAFAPREGGGGTLRAVLVKDERELARLVKKGGEWKESPADFGIETAQAAPEFAGFDATIDIKPTH
jgi:hypothetical protein